MRLVLLAMPKQAQNLHAAQRLAASPYQGLVAATAQFDDEIAELKRVGVHAVFNVYTQAGAGFAEHAMAALEPSPSQS